VQAGEVLLEDTRNERELAFITYEVWRLDETGENYRQQAATLYRNLYERTPVVEYKLPYEILAGQSLPSLPALPDLPAQILQDLPNLESLLARVERRLMPASAGASS
jgi:hypothetical protein